MLAKSPPNTNTPQWYIMAHHILTFLKYCHINIIGNIFKPIPNILWWRSAMVVCYLLFKRVENVIYWWIYPSTSSTFRNTILSYFLPKISTKSTLENRIHLKIISFLRIWISYTRNETNHRKKDISRRSCVMFRTLFREKQISNLEHYTRN